MNFNDIGTPTLNLISLLLNWRVLLNLKLLDNLWMELILLTKFNSLLLCWIHQKSRLLVAVLNCFLYVRRYFHEWFLTNKCFKLVLSWDSDLRIIKFALENLKEPSPMSKILKVRVISFISFLPCSKELSFIPGKEVFSWGKRLLSFWGVSSHCLSIWKGFLQVRTKFLETYLVFIFSNCQTSDWGALVRLIIVMNDFHCKCFHNTAIISISFLSIFGYREVHYDLLRHFLKKELAFRLFGDYNPVSYLILLFHLEVLSRNILSICNSRSCWSFHHLCNLDECIRSPYLLR